MPTGSPQFPAAIRDFPASRADGDLVGQDLIDALAEIEAIETELGIDPAGAEATVADRIAAINTAKAALGQARFGSWRTGDYYGPEGGNLSAGARPNNLLEAVPLFVPRAATVDRVRTRTTAAGQAGAVIRLGCYADNDGVPGSLLYDWGTVTGDSVAVKEITISSALTTGLVWLVAVDQSAATTRPTRQTYTSTAAMRPLPKNAFDSFLTGWQSATSVSGALPASFGTVSGTGAAPAIDVRST